MSVDNEIIPSENIHAPIHNVSSSGGRGGRKVGLKNYNRETLLNVLEMIVPACAEDWRLVTERYQQATMETQMRNPADVKRHFFEKLCNKMKKFIGQGDPPPDMKRAQEILKAIVQKEHTNAGGEYIEEYEDSKYDASEVDENSEDFEITQDPVPLYCDPDASTPAAEEPVKKKMRLNAHFDSSWNNQQMLRSKNMSEGRVTVRQAISRLAEAFVTNGQNAILQHAEKMEELRLHREIMEKRYEAERLDRIERDLAEERRRKAEEENREQFNVMLMTQHAQIMANQNTQLAAILEAFMKKSAENLNEKHAVNE